MTTTSISQPAQSFTIPRMLRVSSFHIGSAMAEILTASVWNRVMITELNVGSTPVALLLALQYLLIPVSIWAGHRSDTVPLWGYRRSSYIWLGRFLALLSFPLLGLSIREFEIGAPVIGWVVATVAFTMFGVGKLMSGSVYLALVRASVPPLRQGLAISIVETALIALFVVMGVVFGRWMPVYDRTVFWQMIIGTTVIAGLFWWLSIFRVEARNAAPVAAAARTPLRTTLSAIWADARTRRFFYFLSLATLAAWIQDVILEPLGGDVFDLPTGATSQFVRYWGGTTIVVLLISFVVWRNRRPARQSAIASVGLAIMAVGILAVGVAAFRVDASLLYLGLVIYGGGFGLYTFGGLSLLAVMSPDRDAGAYLGLWSTSILVFKGLGTFLGGFLRDVFLGTGLGETQAYGVTFVIGAVGLLLAVVLLQTVDVAGFAREHGRPE